MNQTQTRLRRQFVLPNEIFDLGLSGGEILVYAFLIRCEDRETYTCYPSYDTNRSVQIAKQFERAVGMSRNTVGKYVSLLEQKGLIETEQTFFYVEGWEETQRESAFPHPSDPGCDRCAVPA